MTTTLLLLLLPSMALAQDEPAEQGPPIPDNCFADPVGVDGVYEAMELAQMTFEAQDYKTFLDAVEYAGLVLPCLNEPVPRRMAAEWHRLMGLKGVAAQNDKMATLAFAAARNIEPLYKLPGSMQPEGLGVAEKYGSFDVDTGEFEIIEPGEIQFDGRPGTKRPLSWPSIVQVFDENGSVTSTTFLTPSQPVPDYPKQAKMGGGEPTELPVTPEPLPVERGKPEPKMPVLAATGGAAVLATTFFVMASASHGKWADTSTPYSDLEALENKTNMLTTLSLVSGVATVGLGVTVVATW